MSAEAPPQSPSQGARRLQEEILEAIRGIRFPATGASQTEIQDGIRQNLDATAFDKHNQSGIVEVRATFTATRDSEVIFTLEIIWDADNPPTSDRKDAQTAHYGWEIYLDGRRVAGPGHVFFPEDVILPHYRIKSIPVVEESSLKLKKSGKMGTCTMTSETLYFKLQKK